MKLPTIIHDSPFFDRPTTIEFQRQSVVVFSNQIVVWVSLASVTQSMLPSRAKRFPAVLDTGLNHNFAISRRHLSEWAGISTNSLSSLGLARVYGGKSPQLAASIWIHRNRRGSRDQLLDNRPVQLETDRGVIVVTDTSSNDEPRLPLLGLRAICWNHLRLTIDGRKRAVTITRRRFKFF